MQPGKDVLWLWQGLSGQVIQRSGECADIYRVYRRGITESAEVIWRI